MSTRVDFSLDGRSFVQLAAVLLTAGLWGANASVFETPLQPGMENPMSRLRNHQMVALSGDQVGSGAYIEAFPRSITDGGVVTVTMNATADSSVPRNSSCIIGAYAPAGTDVATHVPARLAPCDVDPDFIATGVAKLQFELTNVHSPYSFHVFQCNKPRYRDIQPTCVELGRSTQNVTFSDFGTPFRVRVLPPSERAAYPTSLDIAWSADAAGKPFVEYGTTQGGPYAKTAPANSSRLNRADLCGPPAATFGWQDPLLVNRARLSGLEPGSTVYYRVGDPELPATAHHDKMDAKSREYTLTVPMVAPVDGDSGASEDAREYADNVGVIFIADMGRGNDPAVDSSESYSEYGYTSLYTARTLAEYADSGNTSSTVLVGDVSYATGYEPVWNEYLRMVEPYASRIPNYVGLGNHENCVPVDSMPEGRVPYLYNWTDSGGECGVVTDFHFPMPWKSVDETWYSADVHPRISVVMMSSEHDYLPGSPQLEQLEALLVDIRARKGPKHHIVFLNHRPAYINSEYYGDTKWSGDQRVASMLREFVEPLFRKYNVALALYGHNHSVQRHCAAFGGVCSTRSKALSNLTSSELQWLDEALDGTARSPFGGAEGGSLRAGAAGPEADAGGWWDRNDDDVVSSAEGEVLQERVYLGAKDAVHMVIGTAGAGYTNNAKPVGQGGPEYNERFFYLHGFLHLSAPSPDVLRYQWVYSRTGQVLEVGTIVRSPAPEDKTGWEKLPVGAKAGVIGGAVVGGAGLAALAFYLMRGSSTPVGSDAAYAPIGDKS